MNKAQEQSAKMSPINNLYSGLKASQSQPDKKKKMKPVAARNQDHVYGVQPLPSDDMHKVMEQ